jgi:hypothetical protein
MEAWFDAFDWEEAAEWGTPEREAAFAATVAGGDQAYAAARAVLTVQPTTLAGIAALLDHVGQGEHFDMANGGDDPETILTAATQYTSKEKRKIAHEFPLRLAATMRSILGRTA